MARQMGIKIKGNQGRLGALVKAINTVGAEDRREALREAGSFIVGRIRRNMEGQRDPWGRFWKRSNRVKYEGGKTMLYKRDLFKGWAYQITGPNPGTGFNIFIRSPEGSRSKRYAYVHNEGMTIRPRRGRFMKFQIYPGGPYVKAKKVVIPQRQMLPTGTDVPKAWDVGIRKAILSKMGIRLPRI